MNFLVWRKGLRGPTASLNESDPRSSLDWKAIEPTMIAIIPIAENERTFTLDEACAAHPCPEVVDG